MAEKRPRAKVEPEGHMRERIAVALRGSRPSHFYWYPNEAYTLYLFETEEMREYYQKWADRLLAHFDVLDLEIAETRSTST